jgi:hypothetical protein
MSAMRGPAFFAYANNYLVDVKFGVIVDVEASRHSSDGGRRGSTAPSNALKSAIAAGRLPPHPPVAIARALHLDAAI